MSLITLLCFNHYWQINHLFTQTLLKNLALHYLNNANESILGHKNIICKDKRFFLKQIQKNTDMQLVITWKNLNNESQEQLLFRSVVIE